MRQEIEEISKEQLAEQIKENVSKLLKNIQIICWQSGIRYNIQRYRDTIVKIVTPPELLHLNYQQIEPNKQQNQDRIVIDVQVNKKDAPLRKQAEEQKLPNYENLLKKRRNISSNFQEQQRLIQWIEKNYKSGFEVQKDDVMKQARTIFKKSKVNTVNEEWFKGFKARNPLVCLKLKRDSPINQNLKKQESNLKSKDEQKNVKCEKQMISEFIELDQSEDFQQINCEDFQKVTTKKQRQKISNKNQIKVAQPVKSAQMSELDQVLERFQNAVKDHKDSILYTKIKKSK